MLQITILAAIISANALAAEPSLTLTPQFTRVQAKDRLDKLEYEVKALESNGKGCYNFVGTYPLYKPAELRELRTGTVCYDTIKSDVITKKD